ncbi:hypothetical protein [Desulfurobacterium atlanticum]|uniref:Uncharacterized protein n=1 Tax=Desulfurobacterium atlanticum TaxID=240169 RepID=A0A238Y5M2_9BACT|nr:hypothetical protein [Desulfurobacterium atlanticum]SNR65639.1 hypothetical protein SAMN06265340_10283 [Desulfurobacterium atlanticum]
MLPEEFEAAVEKVLTDKGFDLKVIFTDLEQWDEALFITLSILNEKEESFITVHDTFTIEYLLSNGNVITISFRPVPLDFDI